MSALDDLAPDQRAVLQMILQRGRSYDEIAALLSIDRAAVRKRALDAFDALAPRTVLPGPESALVTDYLLGQLPAKVAEQVYSYLEASDSDRAWALAVAEAIAPLASEALPEIPVGAPLGADGWPAGGLERASDPLAVEAPAPAPAAEAAEVRARPTVGEDEPLRRERPRSDHPSSRRGGAILLGSIVALVLAVIVIVSVTSGGSPKHLAQAKPRGTSTTTTQTVTPTAATGTTSGTGSTTTPQILAQLNLTSPTGAGATIGVAQVIREAGVVGVVIDAQGIPANTSHNAYAVWLYNSATSHRFVGFVRNLVGKSGRLTAEGELPAGAGAYHRLLITLETQQKPSAPGEVILSGPFREQP